MEILAKRLKWLREKQRYSQKEIGDLIGMTVSGYQKLEYNDREPKLDVLVELSKIHEVTTDFLLGLTDETEELKDAAFKSKSLMIEKNKIEKEAQELRMSMNFLFDELSRLQLAMAEIKHELILNDHLSGEEAEKLERNESKLHERIDLVKSRIEGYEYKYKELNEESFMVSKEYSQTVLEYIQLMLDIPDSKIENSLFLKQHMPITTSVQQNLFETYSIYISGNQFNAYMGEFESLEELEKEKLRVDEFLNVK